MENLGIYKNRFNPSGIRVFRRAIADARKRRQNYVSFGHLLKALMEEKAVLFQRSVADSGIDPLFTTGFADKLIEGSPRHEGKGIRISPESIRLFRAAMKIAKDDSRSQIGASDLVFA